MTKNTNRLILGVIFMGGYFALLTLFSTWQMLVKAEFEPLVSNIFYQLTTLIGTVIGFYYGSSQGSADKTDLMAGK